MSATTKERILEAAENIMLAKSFHAVGLTELLAAVRVPKGSFYHYFSSKEQFGVELIAHYVRAHTVQLEKGFEAGAGLARQRFADYWAYLIAHYTKSKCRDCCLVVKLSLEVANFSEPMREALAAGMKQWRSIFERAVREGQADGSICRELVPKEAAALLQDAWQGALQRMLVERSIAPLRSAAAFLSHYLEP